MKAEEKRLEEARNSEKDWKLWGCYVSERAWGTVREDYSADGSAWSYFPFEHAVAKAYRWNEDGIARNLRPQTADLFRAFVMERQR